MSIIGRIRSDGVRVKTKMLAAFIFAVVLSIAGVTFVVSIQINKSFIKNFEVSSTAQLTRMNDFVSTFLGSARNMTEYLATNQLLQEAPGRLTTYMDRKEEFRTRTAELPEFEQRIIAEFAKVQKAFPAYEVIYMADNAGGFVQYPDDTLSAGYNPAKRPWYLQTSASPGAVVTEAYLSVNNEAVCTVAAPVRDAQNRVRGVVAFDINLKTLTNITDNVHIGQTGFVLLIDHLGTVLTDPQPALFKNDPARKGTPILFKNVDDLAADAANPQTALRELRARKSGIAEVTLDGRERLAAVYTTPEGWSLIMMIDKAEVFADAMNVTLSILWVGVGILVIMLIIAWLVARSIANPINTLVDASRAVAGGDLKAIPEDVSFKGELRVLHTSLKAMVAKLAELVDMSQAKILEAENALRQSEESLAQAEQAKAQAEVARREGVLQTARDLTGVVDQLTVAAGQLAGQVEHTDQATRAQRGRMAETATAIAQMNTAVGDVAASAAGAAATADDARVEAKDGRSLVNEVLSYISTIESNTSGLAATIDNLGVQARDIGQVMDMIRDIADQTNLLALNAAIEAARAGEHGRGFAVVADEVRKLAEKTMQSTQNVGTAVRNIQSGMETSTRAMSEVAGVVERSTRIAGRAGEALTRIDQLVERTSDQVRAIAAASEEQSATADEINNNTGEANHIAEEVAEASAQSSETVRKLSVLARQLQDIVRNLQKG